MVEAEEPSSKWLLDHNFLQNYHLATRSGHHSKRCPPFLRRATYYNCSGKLLEEADSLAFKICGQFLKLAGSFCSGG